MPNESTPAEPTFEEDASAVPDEPTRPPELDQADVDALQLEGSIEAGFVSYQEELVHRWMGVIAILGLTLIPAFYILDLLTLQGTGLLDDFAIYRAIAVSVFLVQLIIVRRTAPGPRSALHCHVFILVGSLAITAMTIQLGGFDSPHFAGLLLIVGGIGLLPWAPRQTAIAGAEVVGVYVGLNAALGGAHETANLIIGLFYLGAMWLISFALTRVRYRSSWEEFAARTRLADAEQRLRRFGRRLSDQHVSLKQQHEELRRSKEALIASHQQADRLFAAVANALPGTVLDGKYRLDEKVASGGFGVIYAGAQLTLDRPVAVKLFKPPSAESEDVMFERFRREGVSACRVSHPNAVAVIDTGVSDGGLPYIVMELLRGPTVAQRLRAEGLFELDHALAVLADVSSVLVTAHELGIIHRDIKPSNVLLHRAGHGPSVREVVKVLDFGIAKLIDDPAMLTVTHSGHLLGTPTHMAPERLSAGEASGKADVYSVAVMLYEMLTGRLPFPGSSSSDVWSTMWMQVTQPPEPLDAIDPSVPLEVAELAARGLAKSPDERPSAAVLEAELRRILASLEVQPGSARARTQAEARPDRHEAETAVAGHIYEAATVERHLDAPTATAPTIDGRVTPRKTELSSD